MRPARHPVGAGAALGLVWGGAMRAWMRFITTDPEFTWGGTLGILGVSAFAGALLGLARRRRREGGAGWWRLTGLSLLLLGAGGAAMWPTIVTGAAAVGRPRPAALRLVLAASAAAAQIPVLRDALFIPHGTLRALAGLAWYLPLVAVEVWAFSVVFAPRMAPAGAGVGAGWVRDPRSV